MTCILCNRSHDREGGEMCLLCAVLMAEAEEDIASGRVQDAEEAFAELDKEMEE